MRILECLTGLSTELGSKNGSYCFIIRHNFFDNYRCSKLEILKVANDCFIVIKYFILNKMINFLCVFILFSATSGHPTLCISIFLGTPGKTEDSCAWRYTEGVCYLKASSLI